MGKSKIQEELANFQEKLRKKSRDSQRIEHHQNLQKRTQEKDGIDAQDREFMTIQKSDTPDLQTRQHQGSEQYDNVVAREYYNLKDQKNNSMHHAQSEEKKRAQQQSQGSIGIETPQSQKFQNQQFNRNFIKTNKNDNQAQKIQSEYQNEQENNPKNNFNSKSSRTGKRESRSDTRLITTNHGQQHLQINSGLLQSNQSSQNSQGSSSTAINSGNGNNQQSQQNFNSNAVSGSGGLGVSSSSSGSDSHFKSKQLLEQKQIKLRQILSNSPQTRLITALQSNQNSNNKNSSQMSNFSSQINDLTRNTRDNQQKEKNKDNSIVKESANISVGDETPKSNRSRKNKRIIIDTGSNKSRGEIIIKETVMQQIEIPNTNSTTAITRKIPIDVQKKKKIIKVDQIQRLFKSNTTIVGNAVVETNQENQTQKQAVEIKKISRTKGEISLPNLSNKQSPRVELGNVPIGQVLANYETQTTAAMDLIEEESIQNFEVSQNNKSNKSRFLQKVSSNQSTGDTPLTNIKSNDISDTVNQLRLKRESKTLPQLHLPTGIVADLSPTNNIFSQTNPANMQHQFSSVNDEITYLKSELNMKNNQLSQLLKELRNKPGANAIIATKESSQLLKIRKNPHHQSVLQQPQQIQLKNKNRRGSGGESDSPQQVVIVDENQKTAVPAVIKVKKESKHKSQIEQMKRAISQPELPPNYIDREEMQRSIRESKNKKSGNGAGADQRGGGTAHDNVKNFQSNKEIFEYSPMIQNNYVEAQSQSPKKDENVVEKPYGAFSNQNKAKQVNSMGKKTTAKADGLDSDDIQQKIKGQKRHHESAQAQNTQSDEQQIKKMAPQKGSGSSKMIRKPIKLPFLNNLQRPSQEENKDPQEETKAKPIVAQQNVIMKQNLIEKYQQYNSIYQKQIQVQLANKQELFKENKQSFSMKNLHQNNPIKAIDQESNNTESNFNTQQKSQSKDSLMQYGKMKSIVSNGQVNLAPIKMPSQSSTKSNLSKNMSVGTLVLKRDQIKLNRIDNNSSNNTNTFRNFGSIQASDIKAEIIDSSEMKKFSSQNNFINDSIKPSSNDMRGSGSILESNWNIMEQYQSNDKPITVALQKNNIQSKKQILQKQANQKQHHQFNKQILDEDNPFLDKAEDQDQVVSNQITLQGANFPYNHPLYQMPPNPQMMMMYQHPGFLQHNPQFNMQNYPPGLQQQIMMDQHFHQMMLMNAAALYQQQMNFTPTPQFFNQNIQQQQQAQNTPKGQAPPLPPQIMTQKYKVPQLQGNFTQQPFAQNSNFNSPLKGEVGIQPFDFSDIIAKTQRALNPSLPNNKAPNNSKQVQIKSRESQTINIDPLSQHEMMINRQSLLAESQQNVQYDFDPSSQQTSQRDDQEEHIQLPMPKNNGQVEVGQGGNGPVELNRKMLLQPEEDDQTNALVYHNINPYDTDEELCNYEASDTPRDFFGKVLRDSIPILIVDDKEDDGIRSSTYSVISRAYTDRL